MYNEKHTRSIVLIIIMIILASAITLKLTLREEEQTREETIQQLIEEAKNRSVIQETQDFEQAEITKDYDPLDFTMSVLLFDRLGRDRRPKTNFYNVYYSDIPLYIEVTLFDFATKDLGNKKAAELMIWIETTKDGQIVEEMTKTIADDIIETNTEGLVFYDTVYEEAQPGDYILRITATDKTTGMKFEGSVDFTLE